MTFIRMEKRAGEPDWKEETMEFKDFEEMMAGLLRERFGESAEIRMQDVLRDNGTRRRGILLETEGESLTPVLYLERVYERYQAGEDVEKLLAEMLEDNDRQIREMEEEWDFRMEQFADYIQVKAHLLFRLVNYEKNTELLQEMPYIRWHDLAVIFYYDLGDGQAQIQIHNSHLALWGKTAGDIYQDAMENMKGSLPDDLFPLRDLIPFKAAPGMEEGSSLYVLTNSRRRFGAAAMLYTGKMKELADRLGSDLVILPSSLHEVLLIKDNEEGRARYRETVGEVNRAVVDPEEVLSDNIYHYSRERDAVELLPAG